MTISADGSSGVRIVWGLVGVADKAQLLPASTPDCVEALLAAGFDVDVPEYGPEQLAVTKSPTWLAPVLELVQDVSITLVTEAVVAAIVAKIEGAKEAARLRLRITRTASDGTSTVYELEGSADDVRKQAREIDDVG